MRFFSHRTVLARLRYEMRKSRLEPYPPIVVEHDEQNPNLLHIFAEPRVIERLRLFARLARQRVAVARAPRRKKRRTHGSPRTWS
jgi:hypothetical protein